METFCGLSTLTYEVLANTVLFRFSFSMELSIVLALLVI